MSQKIFKIFIVVIAIALFGYFFRTSIKQDFNYYYDQFFPCQRPITYTIGTIDPRFGISKADFLKAISDAVNIWDKPIGKELFKYDPSGDLKINLVYDTRQANTVKLQQLNSASKDDMDTYNSLKTQYNALQAQYLQRKAMFESGIAKFDSDQSAYNAEVNYWNSRGGADKAEFDKLNAEKASLETEFQNLQNLQNQNNTLVQSINNLADQLNQLAKTLNLSVAQINNIATANGEEFTEGLYVSDSSGQHIDIYQYDNRQKLVRVLAHELGHALGLGHTDNPKDIMYAFNAGLNDVLSANDLVSIKNKCKIK